MRCALALLVAASVQAAPARVWHGVVTHVSDGDSLWVRPLGGGLAQRLRLQGMDAPERCQRWGVQAKLALETLLLGHAVVVEPQGQDVYGRGLARVRWQGVDVGGWMVAQGLAWSSHGWGRAGPYLALQVQAQTAQRGLFSEPSAMAPSVFRRTLGPCP